MSIAQSPLPLERSVQEARADQQAGVMLVDLRTGAERRAGIPAGAVVMTVQDVQARYAREPGWRVNLLCGGGARSLVLAATLRRQGLGPAFSVAGGFERWREAGLPVDSDAARGLDDPGESRYARHLVLPQVGAEGQARLRDARVLLAGLGGLNSPAALYLAAAGVGTLGLVDHDTVDRSNLQRQVLYGEGQLGERKVRSARERLLDLNPDVATIAIEQRLEKRHVARDREPAQVEAEDHDHHDPHPEARLGVHAAPERRRPTLYADDPARPVAAPGADRHLGQELEGAFARPEVGQPEHGVGGDDPGQRDVGEVQSLGDHLRPDQDVDLPHAEFTEDALVEIGRASCRERV